MKFTERHKKRRKMEFFFVRKIRFVKKEKESPNSRYFQIH